jgi:hypothetical protein
VRIITNAFSKMFQTFEIHGRRAEDLFACADLLGREREEGRKRGEREREQKEKERERERYRERDGEKLF